MYHLRLPYPPEIFDVLIDLIADEPRVVLDVGTGTGELARGLVDRVDRVDAVDMSAAMIERGKALPGGDRPRLRWIEGRAEDAPLQPPYALITAGESLHWMDWDVVLPRFREAGTPHALLALLHRGEVAPPWQDSLSELIRRYSTLGKFEPYDLFGELGRRGLFEPVGRHESAPVTYVQSIEEYVASFHSMASLSRAHMEAADAAAFDRTVRELVRPWSTDGTLELQAAGAVVWGRPM